MNLLTCLPIFIVSSNQVKVTIADDDHRTDSPRAEVKQIRVMLPVEDRDRTIPVIQSMQRSVPVAVTHEGMGTRQGAWQESSPSSQGAAHVEMIVSHS